MTFKPFSTQDKFIEAALSGKYRYLCYGGAIRGGKTFVVLAIIILLCRIFPRSRWAIVRKDLPTIKRNLIPSFLKIAPRPFVGEINMSDFTVRCKNGSEIIFFPESLTTDREYNRWHGLEINGFVLEEANELSEMTFNKAIERAGSWKIDGAKDQPPILILLTCNPGQTWVKTKFYDPHAHHSLKAPYFYQPANIWDNPFLTEEYRKSLESLPPELYRRFVKGDWNIQDDPMQIIPYEDLHKRLLEHVDLNLLTGNEALGVDVAELGDDKSILAHYRGSTLYEIAALEQKRTDEVASFVQVRMVERKIDPLRVGIDSIGVGAGVWGNLQGAGFPVRRIIAGSSPDENVQQEKISGYELQFADLKTQMWWMFRQNIIDSNSDLQIIQDEGLIQDLLSMRYRIKSERLIKCETKDETKKRIGRSPDRGDAAIIGNWVRVHREAEPAMINNDDEEIESYSKFYQAERRRSF